MVWEIVTNGIEVTLAQLGPLSAPLLAAITLFGMWLITQYLEEPLEEQR